MLATFSKHSNVDPPMCGVIITFGDFKIGLFGFGGSSSKISNAAPEILPFSS